MSTNSRFHSIRFKYRKEKEWNNSTDPVVYSELTGKWIARVPSKRPGLKTMSSAGAFSTKEEAEAFLKSRANDPS